MTFPNLAQAGIARLMTRRVRPRDLKVRVADSPAGRHERHEPRHEVDGAVAGTIASFRIDDQPEVTYWVDRAHWGKGIASVALQLLLAEIAERPLHARAASDNLGSLRVLEKAGFRRVGVNRDFALGRSEEIEETILRLD